MSWDGKPISKLQSLLRSLGPDSVGKLLQIELRRGGQSHHTKLQMSKGPRLERSARESSVTVGNRRG